MVLSLREEVWRARKKFFVALKCKAYTLKPFVAGWSSLVARQAHNLKVAGSNPAPAPKLLILNNIQKKIISPILSFGKGFEPSLL